MKLTKIHKVASIGGSKKIPVHVSAISHNKQTRNDEKLTEIHKVASIGGSKKIPVHVSAISHNKQTRNDERSHDMII